MKRITEFFKEIYAIIQIGLSGYFDPKYYQTQYPDVKSAGILPLRHYLKYGGMEGRNPSFKFESSFYLHTYPDVKKSGMNPLLHYIRFGKRERRMPVDLNGINIIPIAKWRYYCNEFLNVFSNQKVSVIVPAYNAAHTIVICLKSLIQQTYTNIEIIVVDDGSEDASGIIVQKLADRDKRIRYIKHHENLGAYAAINNGIRKSTGKYIAKEDADDISLSTRIEKQVQAIRVHKVLFSLCLLVRSDLKMEELDAEDHLILERVDPGNPSISQIQMLPQVCFASLIIHKKMFKKHGLYWEHKFSSDAEFLERVLYHERNMEFPDSYKHVNTLFSTIKFMHGLYIVLDEVLYLSSRRNSNNLTIKYPVGGEERIKFIEQWRRRLRNEMEYEYPRL